MWKTKCEKGNVTNAIFKVQCESAMWQMQCGKWNLINAIWQMQYDKCNVTNAMCKFYVKNAILYR